MAKRPNIPKKIREQVLKEFNYRCAIGGEDRPQVHHIDENPANNAPLNLIPLCPNCHLTDQHNPTEPVDQRKVAMFRKHKDPVILTPEFHPLFTRILFLDSLSDPIKVREIQDRAEELMEFVSNLEMGSFYAKQLRTLLKKPKYVSMVGLSKNAPKARLAERRMHDEEYLEQLHRAREVVHSLVVELLRYQKWPCARRSTTKN